MTIAEKLSDLLFSNEQYVAVTEEDKKVLNKTLVSAQARDYNPNLFALLQSDDEIKNHFFVQVKDSTIFKLENFLAFINNRSFLPDSFTEYKNKIGLATDKDNYISNNRDVVLNWPYKDCVLEGGQSKNDQKRSEAFFNEILAPDQINRLLDNKVFTNFKRYKAVTKEQQEARKLLLTEITEVEQTPCETLIPTDNLIIKGNNLVVLHSLKKRFAGKIKLIYIDPPYYFFKIKPADAFKYNSNFKLSSWLVYMSNRLKVAHELLSDNGILLVHINEDGLAYLKLLLNELFKEENFIETFIWKNTDNPDSLSKKSRQSVEYIIAFEKNKNSLIDYIGKDTENGDAPLLNTGNNIKTLKFPAGSIHFNIPDGIIKKGKPDRVEILTDFNIVNNLNDTDVFLSGEFKWSQETLNEEILKGTYFLVKSNKFSIRFQRPEGTAMAPEKYIDDIYLSKAIGVGTNEDASTHLKNLKIDFNFSKPESIVAFFIRAVTNSPNDIVMDFFLGSATTTAVAHKMNRQYIGIEQMDYIESVSVERMKKVLAGEQGGVSKSVNWQGGGEFVYCELANDAENFRNEVRSANAIELPALFQKAKYSSFLSYRVNHEEFNDFESLTEDEQRSLLLQLVDANTLYINYSDIESTDYGISDIDKKLNKQFYRK